MSALVFHEKSGRCQGILWLGKFISMFSFCPDMYFVWLASRAVKAERSEVILSLDGPTSQPEQGSPDERAHGCSPFASFRLPSVFLSPPFHPHSDVSIHCSVQVGYSRFSRCCHLL